MEIRIYYESLEQSLFYLVNDLKVIFPLHKILLVKKSQQSVSKNGFKKNYSKNLSKILIRKNPDLIVTCISNGIEYPLCVIEFSTAVFTKDHEQQRSDNFQLPIRYNVFYIKVSAIKKDSGNHGGDTSYNYLEPFSLCFQRYKKLSFHIEWEVEDDNKKFVKKNPIYRSIPHENSNFINLIKIIIKSFEDSDIDNYEKLVLSRIKDIKPFDEWLTRLTNFNSFEDLKNINSSRTEWFDYYEKIDKRNVFVLKFNRMGHAMDPERGMLSHYNTFFGNNEITFISKLKFDRTINSWYKQTPREIEIKDIISSIEKIDKHHLVKFFLMGLSIPNSDELLSSIKQDVELYNITDFVYKNYQLLNASVRSIFDNSSYLNISNGVDDEVFLFWDKFTIDFNYDLLPDVTNIKLRSELSEDDITYITMNEIFKLNNIEPISVSYPGAQSDTPILPEKEKGRKQERTYIDSIGFKDSNLLLQENKGSFTLKNVKDDILKILKFKNEKNYHDAIMQFSVELNLEVKRIIIGVGFGTSNSMNRDLEKTGIENVDYFVVISKNLDSWKIFSTVEDSIFPVKSSTIDYVVTYDVD